MKQAWGFVCLYCYCSYTGLDIKHLVYMPVGHMVLKIYVPCKIFHVPANICTTPVKLIHTAGKISTCPDWKITCLVEHVTTKSYVPWDKIYMPRACGRPLMSSPVILFVMNSSDIYSFIRTLISVEEIPCEDKMIIRLSDLYNGISYVYR